MYDYKTVAFCCSLILYRKEEMAIERELCRLEIITSFGHSFLVFSSERDERETEKQKPKHTNASPLLFILYSFYSFLNFVLVDVSNHGRLGSCPDLRTHTEHRRNVSLFLFVFSSLNEIDKRNATN